MYTSMYRRSYPGFLNSQSYMHIPGKGQVIERRTNEAQSRLRGGDVVGRVGLVLVVTSGVVASGQAIIF
jgi:hypothetical protein